MAISQLTTADDLIEMEDDGYRYELIAGELIRMPPAKPIHGWQGAEILMAVGTFAKPRRLGIVFDSSIGYQFGHDPDTVLEPDVSFIRTERVPPRQDWEQYFTVAPDLVVEVISPSERRGHITRKVRIYLDAGVRLLWLVDPKRRTATIHAPGRPPRLLNLADDLDGEDVLPGFRLPLRVLFDPASDTAGGHGRNGSDGGQ